MSPTFCIPVLVACREGDAADGVIVVHFNKTLSLPLQVLLYRIGQVVEVARALTIILQEGTKRVVRLPVEARGQAANVIVDDVIIEDEHFWRVV